MKNNTKILLGVAAAVVVGYVVYNKNKSSEYVDFASSKPTKKKSSFWEFWDKIFSARAGVYKSGLRKNK
jgi:hypothetical protein